jgi:hypothetical protein
MDGWQLVNFSWQLVISVGSKTGASNRRQMWLRTSQSLLYNVPAVFIVS